MNRCRFPHRNKGKRSQRKETMRGGAAHRGRQSPIFTGSFSEVPGAAGWDEIQTALSSPRITFSHWRRLFLGTKGDSGGRCGRRLLGSVARRSRPAGGKAKRDAARGALNRQDTAACCPRTAPSRQRLGDSVPSAPDRKGAEKAGAGCVMRTGSRGREWGARTRRRLHGDSGHPRRPSGPASSLNTGEWPYLGHCVM